jgi:hypothetical protein
VSRAGVITKDAWDVVALDNIEQTLSGETSYSSGDAIRRNNVDPDALFFSYYVLHFLCDLYSALNFLGVTMSASKSKLSYIA